MTPLLAGPPLQAAPLALVPGGPLAPPLSSLPPAARAARAPIAGAAVCACALLRVALKAQGAAPVPQLPPALTGPWPVAAHGLRFPWQHSRLVVPPLPGAARRHVCAGMHSVLCHTLPLHSMPYPYVTPSRSTRVHQAPDTPPTPTPHCWGHLAHTPQLCRQWPARTRGGHLWSARIGGLPLLAMRRRSVTSIHQSIYQS